MEGLEADRQSLDGPQQKETAVNAELVRIRERAHANFNPVKVSANGDPKNPVSRDPDVEFGGDI